MDGATLTGLIAERRSILIRLLELSGRQIEVITAGRMGELMGLLAEKQPPLQRLGEISAALREAAGEDAETRHWDGEPMRDACRQAQQECERMHIELLAIEAQCETALTESRQRLQDQLTALESAHQAANRYAGVDAAPVAGARLDLSSD